MQKEEAIPNQNPIFTDLLSLSRKIRNILTSKKKAKIVKCILIIALIAAIFLYEILYIARDCFLEVYSYYQIVVVSLFFIDFYMETICIKIINQYIDVFKWELSNNNEEKYKQLKNNKIRQIIYKLVSKNNNDILPLTMVHHRKMVIGAFVLVFFTQFYFTTNYKQFDCFFSYEPIVMNILFWMMYVLMIVLMKCKCFNQNCLSNDTMIGSSFTKMSITNSQYSNMSVEQLEEEWKLRSTSEKIVYQKRQQQQQQFNSSLKNNHTQSKRERNIKQVASSIVNKEQTCFDKVDEETVHMKELNEIQNEIQNNGMSKEIACSISKSNMIENQTFSQNENPQKKQSSNQLYLETINLNLDSNQAIVQSEDQQMNIEQNLEEMNSKIEQNDSEVCQICLIELQDGEIGREMKCCKKIFHKQCCLQWFNTKETCPNCRALPLLQI